MDFSSHASRNFTANDVSRLLAEADHNLLVRAGNSAYNQRLQQLYQAESQHAALLKEVTMYKYV